MKIILLNHCRTVSRTFLLVWFLLLFHEVSVIRWVRNVKRITKT